MSSKSDPTGGDEPWQPLEPPREPAVNLPPVIIGLSLIMIVVHLVRFYVLSPAQDDNVLLYFAFIPLRYAPAYFDVTVPGGWAADIWTFVTYSFLHGSATHIIFNLLWMVVFGSPVAWRFGAVRFLIFSAVCAAAGAGLHLLFHFGEPVPVIGASAAISGHMAASLRFIFELGGPLGSLRRNNRQDYLVPAQPLVRSLMHPQVLAFIVVWFGLNLASGLWGGALLGAGSEIAWQAHVGGFIAGLVLFHLFDPVARR